MLVYIIYHLLVFYFSSNPYLMTGFWILVGYGFFGLLFGEVSVNVIILSQISSLVSLFSVVLLFFYLFYIYLQFFDSLEPCTFYNGFFLQFFHAATFVLIHISLLLHGHLGINYLGLNCFHEVWNWLLMHDVV